MEHTEKLTRDEGSIRRVYIRMDEGVDKSRARGRTHDDVMNRGFVHDQVLLRRMAYCLSGLSSR